MEKPFNRTFGILRGPFSDSYRNSDSTWRMATKSELKSGLSKLHDGVGSTSLNNAVNVAKANVNKYGQAILLVFRKVLYKNTFIF